MKKFKDIQFKKLKRELDRTPVIRGLRLPYFLDYYSGRRDAGRSHGRGYSIAYCRIRYGRYQNYISRIETDAEVWLHRQDRLIRACEKKLAETAAAPVKSMYDAKTDLERRKILDHESMILLCTERLDQLEEQKDTIESLLKAHKAKAKNILMNHLQMYWEGVRTVSTKLPDKLPEELLCGELPVEETKKTAGYTAGKGDLQWQPMN